MGAVRQLNLGIKVNGKEVEETFKSVTAQMFKLRREVNGTKEGTKEWEKANEELAKVEAKRSGMIERQKTFRKEVAGTTEETKKGTEAMSDFGGHASKTLSSLASGDLVGVQEGLKGMQAGIWGATKAAVAFIATPLGMILAGIALAVAAVTSYFRDSEEGQNAWNKITAVTGAIVGNLTDLLSDLGGMLMKVFSDPKQTLIDLKDAIVTNIENRVTGLIKFFPRLGEAIELALSGKFKEAGQVATDAVLQITTGVEGAAGKIANGFDSATNSVKNFGKEVANEAERAAKLADMSAQADKIERALIIERGKVEAQVAEARLKARDEEKYSVAERKKFLEDAVSLQNGLLDKEIEAASIRSQIKTEQNSFSKSNKADLDEEAQLIAKTDQLRRQKAEAERTMVRDLIRVDGELKKARAGNSSAQASEDEKRIQQLDALDAEYARKEVDRLADTNLKKAQLDMERAVQKAEALGASEELLSKIRAEHQIKIDEEKALEEEAALQRMRDFEAKKLELENELRLARAESDAEREEIQKEIDLEKAELAHEKKLEQFEEEMELLNLTEEERAQVLAALEDAKQNTILGIQKKYTDKKIEDEERLHEAKKQLWNDSLDAAINLAGAETKVGQALLIAKQIMAAKEMAVELGLFQSKIGLKAAEATGDIAAGQAKTAAAAPFPANVPLIIGFVAQVAGIVSAIRNAAKAKSKAKTSFAKGGYTDLFGMGHRDETGEEVAGVVHTGEYVVPKVVRQDPEVPQIIDYLENKRKKKLGLYASGGDVDTSSPGSTQTGTSTSDFLAAVKLLINRFDAGLEANIYWDYEAEQKRQKMLDKLKKVQDRSKLNN